MKKSKIHESSTGSVSLLLKTELTAEPVSAARNGMVFLAMEPKGWGAGAHDKGGDRGWVRLGSLELRPCASIPWQ